jgi:hypothetical protein
MVAARSWQARIRVALVCAALILTGGGASALAAEGYVSSAQVVASLRSSPAARLPQPPQPRTRRTWHDVRVVRPLQPRLITLPSLYLVHRSLLL